MPAQRAGCKKVKRQPFGLFWSRFSPERCTNLRSARYLLEHNLVSLSVTSPCTLRDIVEKITRGAHVPIPIVSLSDTLSTTTLTRGNVCFGYTGDLLNQIAENYANMRWWISDDGLNMEVLLSDVKQLSQFDVLAGRLTLNNWKTGRLSRNGLWEIAKALDSAGFSLRDHLQPAQWKAIGKHNREHSRDAIKTFDQAVRRPQFVRSIR